MTAYSPETTVRVRPMQPADLEQVQAIDRISFSMPWPTSAYQYELKQNPLSLLWVAEVNPPEGRPQVVGLIVVWLILDEAHIATVAVHPEFRQRGIARRIMATALAGAVHKGARLATLEVRTSNIAAQKLYRRFGFEVVGVRPRYYRDNNEDALIMTVSGLGEDFLQKLDQLSAHPRD